MRARTELCALTLMSVASAIAWSVQLPAQMPTQVPTQVDPGELLGCWQRTGEGKVLIRVEPARISFCRDGKLDIYRAAYTKDCVLMNIGGMRGEYRFVLADHVLEVETGGQVEKFHKMTAVPDELVVKPLEPGQQVPDADRVRAIQKELAERAAEDQAVRKDQARGKDGPDVDRRNTEWLVGIVKQHGWVDATRFGTKAASQAFLLVQHSGHLPLMTFALPLIEADVRARRVDPQDFALLCDRLRLRLGDKQRYGSQIGRNNSGEQVVLATEDQANVDVRRRELGLTPLGEYLQLFKQQNGGKLPAFDADW